MKPSIERRSRRWVLRELDRSAAARPAQASIPNPQSDQAFGVHRDGEYDPDALTVEYRVGRRTEYKNGEAWVRDTLDGHILEIRAHEVLAMLIAACIQPMGGDHSIAPAPEKTRRLVADPA
jgi:hypothetical protein